MRKPYKKYSVGEFEEKYGLDLGVAQDMKLTTYMKQVGAPSLAKLLEMTQKWETNNQTNK